MASSDYVRSKRIRLVQYLTDVAESLNCPLDVLVQQRIFSSKEEISDFVNNFDDGNNFCILRNINSEDFLFFIPISKCIYDKVESKCTDKNCRRFHLSKMCFFFVYKKCQFSAEKCRHSHHFNRRLPYLSERKLDDYAIDEISIMKLIRLSQEPFPINFCLTLNCNSTDCNSFHWCRHHMGNGFCSNSNGTCKYEHSLAGDNFIDRLHNQRLLKAKNLDKIIELDLRNYIHDAYNGIKNKTKFSTATQLKSDLDFNNTLVNLNNFKISSEHMNKTKPIFQTANINERQIGGKSSEKKAKNLRRLSTESCKCVNCGMETKVIVRMDCECLYCDLCMRMYIQESKGCLNRFCKNVVG